MRGELAVTLESGKRAVVREIRPLDYRLALVQIMQHGDKPLSDVDPTEWDDYWWRGSDLIETTGEVTHDDLVLIQAKFLLVNSVFFAPSKKQGANEDSAIKRQQRKKLSSVARDLDLTCVALISHNHQHCWLYGWQFFKAVQSLYTE